MLTSATSTIVTFQDFNIYRSMVNSDGHLIVEMRLQLQHFGSGDENTSYNNRIVFCRTSCHSEHFCRKKNLITCKKKTPGDNQMDLLNIQKADIPI